MDYQVVSSVKNLSGYDCLLFPVINQKLDRGVKKIDNDLVYKLRVTIQKSSRTHHQGNAELITKQSLDNNAMVLLLYFDNTKGRKINDIKKTLFKAITILNTTHAKSILVSLDNLRSSFIHRGDFYLQLTTFFEQSAYRYEETNPPKKPESSVQNITFFEPQQRYVTYADSIIQKAKAIAEGINYSRRLSDLPANICTPSYLAKKAVSLSKKINLKVTVINERQMKTLGMNLILAVSKGSQQPAKLITLEYQGADLSESPIVLIGKGLTFDSGGYSIKSAPAMDEMKYDMCGAAAVMGTILAVAKMSLPINLTVVIPTSENVINGKAFKPGDVLTSMSGQTVEILSTDAEGRLLIADALTYVERYCPSLIVDVATLTGACITALGSEISGLMSNNQMLARRLAAAGEKSHDHVWQLPLWKDYEQVLRSNFADMASSAGRDDTSGAGAIVAASFLSKFASSQRWAHLDIAGPAWLRGKDKGATGRPVSLLCQFIIDYCDKPFSK